MYSNFESADLFIGPLPQEEYEVVTDQFNIFRQDIVAETMARALYGQKKANLALSEMNDKLANREIDPVSGVLSKDEWMEKATIKVTGLRMGQRAVEKRSGALLLMFDAEKFKAINDEISWSEGDRRLGIIGNYLKNNARLDEGDLVGRLGGDEFVWLATFDQQATTGVKVLGSIEARLRDVVQEQYPDLLPLRWNHVIYESGEELGAMLKRLDVKGQQKNMARSHSQSEQEYELARHNAGIALSN